VTVIAINSCNDDNRVNLDRRILDLEYEIGMQRDTIIELRDSILKEEISREVELSNLERVKQIIDQHYDL
jgi:uncharacterized coiled-coil protein SlyX